MKKLLLGCGVVSLLVVISVGVLAYYFVYLPGKQVWDEGVESYAHLQEAQALDDQVRNKAAFSPPRGGELSESQVTRFVKVQESVLARLGPRVKELDTKYAALDDEHRAEPQSFSEAMRGLKTLGSGLKDLGGLMLEAKRAQVDALNEQGFSLQEYQWTRGAVYAALGMPVSEDIGQEIGEAIRRAAESGSHADMIEQVNRAVPEINRTLVAPHAEKLTEAMGLFVVGM